MSESPAKDRLDKWLWHARFFKTRSLAATQVSGGAIRVNGDHVTKRATQISAGDVLTFSQGRHVRVIKVGSLATRRGPATEAQTLYEDLSPPQIAPEKTKTPENPAYEGKGRPTKRDRRQADLSKLRHLE